jgi:hypothetical protein
MTVRLCKSGPAAAATIEAGQFTEAGQSTEAPQFIVGVPQSFDGEQL